MCLCAGFTNSPWADQRGSERELGNNSMSDIELTLACGDYELTRPLTEGSVKAEGIVVRSGHAIRGQRAPLGDGEAQCLRRLRVQCASLLHGARSRLPLDGNSGVRASPFPARVHLRQPAERHPRTEGSDRQAYRRHQLSAGGKRVHAWSARGRAWRAPRLDHMVHRTRRGHRLRAAPWIEDRAHSGRQEPRRHAACGRDRRAAGARVSGAFPAG